MSTSEEDDYIMDLILSGALEFAGLDPETGEMLYSFTDKLATIDPHLYRKFNEEFYEEVMNLWQMGFLNINMMEDNPLVRLTDKAFEKNEVEKLDKNHKKTLYDIIRAFVDGSAG